MTSVNRIKVDFDPLSALGCAPEAADPLDPPSAAASATTAPSSSSSTSSSVAATSTTSSPLSEGNNQFSDRSFTTNASKSKAAASSASTSPASAPTAPTKAAISEVPSAPTTSSGAGTRSADSLPAAPSTTKVAANSSPFMQGFTLSDESYSRAPVEPLFAGAPKSASSGAGLFSSAAASPFRFNEESAIDSLLGTDKPRVAERGTGIFRLNVENIGDDTKLDGLQQVTSMLELEEKLDYELFGRSNAAIGGVDKRQVAAVAVSPAVSVDQMLDSSVLNSSIFDLQISDSAPSFSYVGTTSATEFSVPPPPSDSDVMQSLSSGAFDINAYIQSQAGDSNSGGGGLFD